MREDKRILGTDRFVQGCPPATTVRCGSGLARALVKGGRWAAAALLLAAPTLVLQGSVQAQVDAVPGERCIGSFAFLCISAFFAGVLIYVAMRLFRSLTGYDLAAILKGNRPLSFGWVNVLALGAVAGALATLLAALVCLLL